MAYALCDERISKKCRASLIAEGFSLITMPKALGLPSAISSHTDMLFFSDGKTFITSEEYRKTNSELFSLLESALHSVDFLYTEDKFGSEYPNDAIFNALLIDNRLFIRMESCSSSLLRYAEKKGIKVIPVNQGYPACTVLGFGNCAITADRGMARVLENEGITVTLIENSDCISLPPYTYGFIGGAAGVYKNKIYFLGNLDQHPDFELIKGSIKAAGYSPVFLDCESSSLYDLGGIRFFD